MAGQLTDKDICQTLLSIEKQISGLYNSGIMEAAHDDIRQSMMQIQDEEFDHGKQIFNAMVQRGWYTPAPANQGQGGQGGQGGMTMTQKMEQNMKGMKF